MAGSISVYVNMVKSLFASGALSTTCFIYSRTTFLKSPLNFFPCTKFPFASQTSCGWIFKRFAPSNLSPLTRPPLKRYNSLSITKLVFCLLASSRDLSIIFSPLIPAYSISRAIIASNPVPEDKTLVSIIVTFLNAFAARTAHPYDALSFSEIEK